MADPLAGLSQSPEAQIATGFLAVLRGDTLLASAFRPILLIESPTREAFNNLTVYTMALVPFRVKMRDHPSGRSTILVDLVVSAYLPKEPTDEESQLRGLDLGSHIRKLAYSNADLSGVAFDAVDFAILPALEPKDTNVRILSFQITFSADIAPASGQFV